MDRPDLALAIVYLAVSVVGPHSVLHLGMFSHKVVQARGEASHNILNAP